MSPLVDLYVTGDNVSHPKPDPPRLSLIMKTQVFQPEDSPMIGAVMLTMK